MAMLHSFASAVRFGSFSRAGEEVGLTQSAISRQIANLEEYLGNSLFDRTGRRVVLNSRGRLFAQEIEPALAQIRRASQRAMREAPDKVIELATLPSFGMRWLIPRLHRLSERHPDLVVNIAARTDIFDFAVEPHDAAIHVGGPNWPRAAHDFLFEERVLPVVAPRLAAEYDIARPEDLLRVPLLVQSARRDAWDRWFTSAGVADPAPSPISHIAHFLMLSQAVTSGSGAALLPTFLIEAELRSGALITPFDLPLTDELAYYLVYPEDRRDWPSIAALRNWMVGEATTER